ncbi:nucleotidyltransferase family protein [uncultured Treponema sp.]|uniref:nucleotidyltransferase family protein n=1 Tax=uncultured Treponema sp. TaxID=162155 RepID=UPI0025960478|nr:nucleotidyltransferase family protein [uncultured Treponema sp.]
MYKSEEIKTRSIKNTNTIIEALKKMDTEKCKLLFVLDGENFAGILTIGDIQRAIINAADMNSPVSAILDTNKVYAFEGEKIDSIRQKMYRLRAECMPVLNENKELVDVIFWKDAFKDRLETDVREKINLPVVIMAGGKGTRLKPITNVIPKPLVPVGDKTILEEIMDQFESIGCKNFYMSINYKSDMMRFYLDHTEHKYNIEFFEEPKPLGTIGSVSLLKDKIKSPFFVTNCDILIDQDFIDVYDYHIENKNDITMVTAVKSFHIPYGVIETGEDGLMTGLKEKPDITYKINTGVYILNPELIKDIPENQFFHITDLMEVVKTRGGRVGCFPVSENSWRDMGEWPEYLKMINVF